MNFFVQFLSMASKANFSALSVQNTSMDSVDVTEPVNKFAYMIEHYGALIVMLAVILCIFVIVIIAMLRSHSKLMNQVIKDHGGKEHSLEGNILLKLADALINHHKTTKSETATLDKPKDVNEMTDEELLESVKEMLSNASAKPAEHSRKREEMQINDESYHHDLLGAFIDVHAVLKDASRETLRELRCSRVAIYVFHNGNKSMFGLPFFKMSCVHEWGLTGANTPRSRAHTDLPLHLFNDFIEDLWRYGYYKAQNVDIAIQKDNSIREFVAYSDTKALYFAAIKDKDGIISGFVVAEFDEFDTFESDENRDNFVKGALDRMAIQVQPIIGSPYVYHPNHREHEQG